VVTKNVEVACIVLDEKLTIVVVKAAVVCNNVLVNAVVGKDAEKVAKIVEVG
jgi:hypothetical protein